MQSLVIVRSEVHVSHEDRLTEEQCVAVLDLLFPSGPSGEDVLRELASGGWEHSPLLQVFHPSLEQRYTEAVRFHENIKSLSKRRANEPEHPEPTLKQVQASYHEEPVLPAAECGRLLTLCLWDIFSDNHDVYSPDGRLVDLGSFRGSAGVLADWLDRHLPGTVPGGYLDVYMGTIWIAQRADLTPVYRLIFSRLKRHQFDWSYTFPRLHVVDLRPLRDQMKRADEPDWLNYDPSAAVAEEQKDRELAAVREELDDAATEAARKAAQVPPPPTVTAYREVFGSFPRGWPPV
jgi:hypothetical protein